MKVIHSAQELQGLLLQAPSIGFVPTMGALHQGHLELVRRSRYENDVTVVSIFVNPTQFNDPKDFQSYPRTLEQDCSLLQKEGVDFIFAPNAEEMYPNGRDYAVEESRLSQVLCGQSRPGHFSGMLTVVLKLLNIVRPHRAYFGEKDQQQLKLIQGMAQAFFLPVEIVPCPTVRDENGLALSSRNQRLSERGLDYATRFAQALKLPNLEVVRKEIARYPIEIDYLEEIDGRRYAAVKIEDVRLIDNVPL